MLKNFVSHECFRLVSDLGQQYKKVFKSDSSNFVEAGILNHICHKSQYAVREVPGLAYIPNYFNEDIATSLIKLIDEDTSAWNTSLKRRTQHYGYIYDYTSKQASEKTTPIPSLIKGLQPFNADQVIINEYEPGQGISAHTDSPKQFGSYVATISLLSSIPMTFTSKDTTHTVMLEPRSIAILIDDARYKFTHEIPSRKTDAVGGIKSTRSRRVSVTYRSMK